jgi:glutathione reductase (NADPH)
MIKKGVDIRLGAKVRALEADGGDATRIVLADGSALLADAVLYATGRAPNTGGLGLEAVGVELDVNGAVLVDDRYRSNVPSIYAIGDVIDRVQLTPVALAEAMALVDDLFGGAERHVDYLHIPTAVFTHPNIGTIGLSEDDARGRFERIRVYRSEFKPLRHTLSGSSERTMMKLVVDDANDRVVGLHMVGADAGETIQGFAVAMKAGATKAVFDATLGIHPTAAEEFVTMREPVVASSSRPPDSAPAPWLSDPVSSALAVASPPAFCWPPCSRPPRMAPTRRQRPRPRLPPRRRC